MDYTSAFAISASGMDVEKSRLETIALNLANVNSTAATDGTLYQPVRLLSGEKSTGSFDVMLNRFAPAQLPAGVEVRDVAPLSDGPRLVHEPGHPAADEAGFVAYPNVNPVSEMLLLIETTRSYEANVRALNAAKTMALAALEIGRAR